MKLFNKNILTICIISSVFLIISCTKKFDEYNTHPFNPMSTNMTDAEKVGALFPGLIATLHYAQENKNQHTEQFVFGQYAGYFATTNNWHGTNFGTYNPSFDWIEFPYKNVMSDFNSNYIKIKNGTGSQGYIYAWSNIIRVASMHRVVDTYGPIPYIQIGLSNDDRVPFDAVETIYKKMFDELDESIEVLTNFVEGNANYKKNNMVRFDPIYAGDFAKWIKYANSLKMRLAIRISSVDGNYAKQKFQEAYIKGGIEMNVDNAFSPTQDNPYLKASMAPQDGWGDLAINATLSSYMNGFADPRISKYMTTNQSNGYRGVRSGIRNVVKEIYTDESKYSKPAFTKSTPLLLFNASETAFLKAEAALLNWIDGGDAKAKEFYELGVRLSMEYYTVPVGSYLAGNTQPAEYASPDLSRANISVANKITVSWDDTESRNNTKLEKIITQKWIANFPYGLESWSDFRRTGFPQIFPALDNLSSVGFMGTIGARQVRRLPYPQSLYRTNGDLVQQALSLLGGDDNANTDLWWAKKN